MAIFLCASMAVLATSAVPSIFNDGRREREQQLIWRGNQYVRAVRLYFQKNGRFPQNMDELRRGTLDIHFLRKSYEDPVGPNGAEWRVIYVAPSGQLVGSVHYRSLQEMAAALGGSSENAANLGALFGQAQGGRGAPGPPGLPPGATGTGRGGPTGRGGALGGPAGPGRGGRGAPGTQFGQPGLGGPLSAGQPGLPAPLEAVDGPVLGASMIGVASKVKRPSLMIYQGKETYFEWEFIWNPLLNAGGVGPPPGQDGAPGEPPPGAEQAPGTAAPGTPQGQAPPGMEPPGNVPPLIDEPADPPPLPR
jgi:hypothetical protein